MGKCIEIASHGGGGVSAVKWSSILENENSERPILCGFLSQIFPHSTHIHTFLKFLHPASAVGVIVLALSVCLSVHPSVSLSWPNKHRYRPEFWHIGHA